MTTLVVVALDNLTLRLETDEPKAPGYLLAVGTLSNDALERDKEEHAKIYGDLLSSGRAMSMTRLEHDGFVHTRHVPMKDVVEQ